MCHARDQQADVVVEVWVGAQGKTVAIGEGGQARRQVGLPRHGCSLHEHRDDRDVAVQCGFHLDAHEVAGVVEPAAPVVVRDGEPLPPDDNQHHLAPAHGLAQRAPEVPPERDVVHILEHALLAELPH